MFFRKNELSGWSHWMKRMGSIPAWGALALASYGAISAVEPEQHGGRETIVRALQSKDHQHWLKGATHAELRGFLNGLDVSHLQPADVPAIKQAVAHFRLHMTKAQLDIAGKTVVWQWLKHNKGVAKHDCQHREESIKNAIKNKHYALLDSVITEMIHNIQRHGYDYSKSDKLITFHQIVCGLVKKPRLPRHFDALFSKAVQILHPHQELSNYHLRCIFQEAMLNTHTKHLPTIVQCFREHEQTTPCLHSVTKRKILEHAASKSYAHFRKAVTVLNPSRTLLVTLKKRVQDMDPDGTVDTARSRGNERRILHANTIIRLIDRLLQNR